MEFSHILFKSKHYRTTQSKVDWILDTEPQPTRSNWKLHVGRVGIPKLRVVQGSIALDLKGSLNMLCYVTGTHAIMMEILYTTSYKSKNLKKPIWILVGWNNFLETSFP